ncbi:MOSC domain-containing protein, partial [Xanthomonas citri pv. citri]
VQLGRENLAGDRQSNRKYHGGPDKAVCVYASEHYPLWRQEFDKPEQPFGSFGENLTTTGLVEDTVCIGDVYRVPSGATIQVCQPRVPCAQMCVAFGMRQRYLRGWRKPALLASTAEFLPRGNYALEMYSRLSNAPAPIGLSPV